MAKAVKGAAFDEGIHHPLVAVSIKHPLAKIGQGSKIPPRLPLVQYLEGKTPAHALHGGQTKTDPSLGHGKVGPGVVHIRGQQGNAAGLALGNILGYLGAGVQHRGQKSRHILPGIVVLEPGGLVGYDRVGQRVRLIEGILGKGVDLPVDLLGHLLGDPVGHTAHDIAGGISMDKVFPLLLDLLPLFFGHGPTDHIGLTDRIPRQLAEDLYDLFLIDDTTIGH